MMEIIVDSFAGGGGASTGIEIALGRSPDIAINHDAEALSMHAANHPDTLHLPHNVWKVDPHAVTAGRPVGLLWASPDCKHFSKAKGGKPVARNIRDLAWVVVRWARQVRPRVIILENVEEFQGWGPLREDGMPCPERKGETFRQWTGELRKLGYKVEWREMRACDYGAPTIRKRLFLIARRDGRPIIWPKPAHGDPKSEAVKSGKLRPWRTAAEIIDWSLPCPSIFLTKEEARAVGAKRPLAEATMARIAKGVQRYVLDAAKPFVVSFRHDQVGRAIDESLATVTANSFIKRPGGAVPLGLVTPFTAPLTHQGGDRAHSLEEPARTVTAAHRGEAALVAPVLSYAQQGGAVRSPETPLHTITASSKDQNCLVAPHLMTMRNAQKPFNGADEPTHTVTAGGAGLSLVAPYLVPRYGERDGQEPRTMRADSPIGTIVPDSNQGSLAAIHLSRQFGASIGSAADAPVGTITAGGGGKTALVAAFLAQNNYQEPGHDAREPMSTIVAKGSTQSVVSAGILNLKGSDRRDAEIDEPAPTICAGGGHVAEVRAFIAKYYGSTEDGQPVDEPLHTATAKPRFGLVTVEINGEPYAIVDIGMRMLSPRELFRAQGFPDSYIIDRGADGAPLTKTSQNRMCGNSVCPPMAAALVAANYAVEDVDLPAPFDIGPLFTEAAE
ncbi:DNA cytosine methyltransferase [Kaistia sp. MMO-174]|uniref:DNA cytosine methyltransferase n=1 Tax=Kaistia sp. MMO-174 TaxID=3081256 RepID=UPI00301A9DD9